MIKITSLLLTTLLGANIAYSGKTDTQIDQYLNCVYEVSESITDCSLVEQEDTLHTRISPEQYKIVILGDTEPAYANKFWDFEELGLYVDIISGEVLFSSLDKMKSTTGWPSFSKPLVKRNIRFLQDESFGLQRIKVKSKKGDSHLGHVYRDRNSSSGFRYSINSGALKFIPKEKLLLSGHIEFEGLFRN